MRPGGPGQLGGASMETFGSVLSVLEQQSFTGRNRELRLFLTWLQERRALPSLLNVIGPGGVGKTTLLRAFGRQAKRLGQPVMVVDGHDLEATPLAFLSALGTAAIDPAPALRRPPISSGDEVAEYLNQARPLLLIDTFEDLGPVGRYLREELLPRLS